MYLSCGIKNGCFRGDINMGILSENPHINAIYIFTSKYSNKIPFEFLK